jgi:ATP diphosphatase
VAEEIGDLLFSVVNYSRHCGVDPEIALRAATSKFKTRFQAMEKAVPNLKEKNLEELDDLWNQVKKAGQVGS